MKKLLLTLLLVLTLFAACGCDENGKNGYEEIGEAYEEAQQPEAKQPAQPTPTPEPIPEPNHFPDAVVLHHITFDESSAEAYGEYFYPGEQVSGELVDDFGNADNFSFRLTNITGNYTSAMGNFIVLGMPEYLKPGSIYEISWYVYIPSDRNHDKTTIPGSGLVLNGMFGSGDHQPTNDFDLSRNTRMDEWVNTTVQFTIGHATGPIEHLAFRFRVNETERVPTVWYIDDINITLLYHEEYTKPEWDLTLPSLAEAFAEYFLMGNIWSTASRMNAFNTNEGFLHHFNSVTAENNHKVDTIAANRGTWTFRTADEIVGWAEENDLAMIGHTLVWHSQSPPWLTTVPGTTDSLTRAEAIENMHLYISTVASRFSGRMAAWDVVNEAVWGVNASNWQANPDWRAHLRSAGRGLQEERQSQWYDTFANGATGDECGSDYIFYAFRFARIYDPFAILYYNDYNDHVPGKRDAIAQMVGQINKRWQNDPLYDGRLLIEGIGMQSHYSISGWMSNPRYVREAIELYITTGARISITEWDIVIGGNAENLATPNPELFETQAERFALLMSWYLEFSDYIERVTIWGKTDGQSWVSWGFPVIFDENFQPKPAFFALLETLGNAPPPNISIPTITTASIPRGNTNQQFAYQLTAEQTNFAPITWRITDGNLPPGLRLISTTGVIMGTPAQSGSFTFTVEAENAAGSGIQTFTIQV